MRFYFHVEGGRCEMEIGVVGVPVDIAQSRDYPQIFSEMKAAGISLFLPMSLYQEVGTPLGTGYEVDFFPPPFGTADVSLYEAARAAGVKFVVSADLMYRPGSALPTPEQDPLRALIDAAGRDLIHAVYAYDEPVLNGVSATASRQLYEHVKAVDPTLPVIQVQAAIPEGVSAPAYLADVRAHAAWADQVGFAVYPVGPVPGALSPYSDGQTAAPLAAIADYARWLEENLPDKKHVGVLQGFGFADLFPEALLATYDPALVAAAQAPTQEQMRAMAAGLSGMDSLFWFGPSYLDSADGAAWRDITAVSRDIAGLPPESAPIGPVADADAAANTISEAAMVGAAVGVIATATDPDAADTIVYTIDDDRFAIAADGAVTLARSGALDYDAEPTITFTVTATSSDGSSAAEAFEIDVRDAVKIIGGGAASEELIGSRGADIISGKGGDDWIWGRDGADTLIGDAGADMLIGEAGDDTLLGGDGDDMLYGGPGRDILTGGAGGDLFIFFAGDEAAVITDYTRGADALAFVGGVTRADLTFTAASGGVTIGYGSGEVFVQNHGVTGWGDGDFFFA